MRMAAPLGLILILLVVSAGGCWSRREVNELALVTVLGIDVGAEGEIATTAQVVIPGAVGAPGLTGGAAGQEIHEKPVWITFSRGQTLFEALREYAVHSPRRLCLSHTEVVVVGEDLARQGLSRVLDPLIRDNEVRLNAWLLVARGTAKDVIEVEPEVQAVPSEALLGLIRLRDIVSKAPGTDLRRFMIALTSDGAEPFLAAIEPIRSLEEEFADGQPVEHDEFRLAGVGVFRGDRLVGWMNERETRGLLWVRQEARGAALVLDNPAGEGRLAVEVQRARSRVEASVEGGTPRFEVTVDTEGNLMETTDLSVRMSGEFLRQVEKGMAGVIRQDVLAAVRKAQEELAADVFGFGEGLRRAGPAAWRRLKNRWQEEFPAARVEVRVNARLRRTGLMLSPARPK